MAEGTCVENGCLSPRAYPARYCVDHKAQDRRSKSAQLQAAFEERARMDREAEKNRRLAEEDGIYRYKYQWITAEESNAKYPEQSGTYLGVTRTTEPQFKPAVREMGAGEGGWVWPTRLGTSLDPEPPKPAESPRPIVGLQRQYFED